MSKNYEEGVEITAVLKKALGIDVDEVEEDVKNEQVPNNVGINEVGNSSNIQVI